MSKPYIVGVASGKGGVGKSTISTNLGIQYARSGLRTILVDADFGGANLHTLLGLSKPKLSLSDFLEKEVLTLQEAVVPTGRTNLSAVCGVRSSFNMANFPHAQKVKLLRHLSMLDADVVILDIGAGTSFHVLDLFLTADHRIVVTTPTKPALENAYHLIRASIVRYLRGQLKSLRREQLLTTEQRLRMERGQATLLDVVNEICVSEPETGRVISDRLRKLGMSLIVNRIQVREDFKLGPKVTQAFEKYFGWEMELLGNLSVDRNVEVAEKRLKILSEVDKEQQSVFIRTFQPVASSMITKVRRDRGALSF